VQQQHGREAPISEQSAPLVAGHGRRQHANAAAVALTRCGACRSPGWTRQGASAGAGWSFWVSQPLQQRKQVRRVDKPHRSGDEVRNSNWAELCVAY